MVSTKEDVAHTGGHMLREKGFVDERLDKISFRFLLKFCHPILHYLTSPLSTLTSYPLTPYPLTPYPLTSYPLTS